MVKQTLSAAFIVKDEILTIERIVTQALAVADEVVVVDTGSTDGCDKVAAALGAKVLYFDWIDDFSAARNFAFDACTMEWILWLDADDVLPLKSQAVIKALLEQEQSPLNNPDIRAVWCPYHYQFDPTGAVSQVVNRERILRNHCGHRWVGPIHETIEDAYTDSAHISDLIIEHRTAPENNHRRKGRNRKYLEKFVDLETSELRWLWLYGSELATDLEFDASNKVLMKYFDRSQNQPDPIGERYAVIMKLAFNGIAQKQPTKVAHWAFHMLAQDASRAEGYVTMAVAFLQLNQVQSAWPMLVAGLNCRKPPPQNIIIIDPLYRAEPLQLIQQVIQQVPGIRDDIYRLGEVNRDILALITAADNQSKAAAKLARKAEKRVKK